MKRILLSLVAALAALVLPAVSPGAALAMPHGGTYTAKYVDGANVVVLNYTIAGDLKTGVPITHNLRVYDLTGQPIAFQEAKTEWRLGEKVKSTQTTAQSPNNDVNVVYEYSKAGTYTLTAHFADNGKEIAKGEFPLVVAKGSGVGLFTDILTLPVAGAFLLGIGAAELYHRRKSLKIPQVTAKYAPKQAKRP